MENEYRKDFRKETGLDPVKDRAAYERWLGQRIEKAGRKINRKLSINKSINIDIRK